MLKEQWSSLVETNVLCDFIDTLLRGYGQILFCNSPAVGLILLIGFVDKPVSAISALIGGILASASPILMHTERSLIKSGLFGCSGGLIGFALSVYLPLNLLLLIPFLILAGILSALLTKFLINTLSLKYKLPVLSVPFVIVTWVVLVTLRYIPGSAITSYSAPSFLMGGQVERVLAPLLPESLDTIFRTMGAILFQNNALIGMMCLLGIITYSRILTLFGLAGGTIGIALVRMLATTGDYTSELTVGFNCALIGIALGGFFIALTWQSILYALFALFVGAVTSLASIDFLGNFNIPPLAAPFNFVVLLFLCVLRAVSVKSVRVGLRLIPLSQTNKPEANLDWRLVANARRRNQQVKLSLPFCGIWYVFCGNNSQTTHRGASAYAWDFVVLDEHKRLCRGAGTTNEDYYSFGLPVLSPAPGTIVKVTSLVPDNIPPNVNWEQSWGNCVIIDHGKNELSEISHFRQHSIVVKEGDKVVKGQLLGYCGNSGLSMSPHIHYQLQRANNIAAQSVPAKFHNYITYKGSTKVTMKEGIPKEKGFVSNSLAQVL